jgi:hypothetical protein
MVLLLVLLAQVAVVGIALALLLVPVTLVPTPPAMPATAEMAATLPLLLLLLLVVLAATRLRVTAVPARPTLARVVTRAVVRALPTAVRVPLERAAPVTVVPVTVDLRTVGLAVVLVAQALPTAPPVVPARVVVLVVGTPAQPVAVRPEPV